MSKFHQQLLTLTTTIILVIAAYIVRHPHQSSSYQTDNIDIVQDKPQANTNSRPEYDITKVNQNLYMAINQHRKIFTFKVKGTLLKYSLKIMWVQNIKRYYST